MTSAADNAIAAVSAEYVIFHTPRGRLLNHMQREIALQK
jgi:hypothetical protein